MSTQHTWQPDVLMCAECQERTPVETCPNEFDCAAYESARERASVRAWEGGEEWPHPTCTACGERFCPACGAQEWYQVL